MNKSNYEDNLQRFERFCPEASKQIRTLDCSHIEFCQTAKGELNLRQEVGNKTLYYHSQEGALSEAQEWLEKTFPLGIQVLCVYGIGLGYYYDVLKEWLRTNSSRFLVFIEDDLCVLKRFLETDKASEILKNIQVLIQYFETPGEMGWGKFREEFKWFTSGFAQSSTLYEALKLYKEEKEHMYKLVSQQLTMNQTEAKWVLDELFINQELVSANLYLNLTYASEAGIANKLTQHFPDIPTIIIGAGPSLNKHFEILKTLRNKAILFGSGTAMNILTRNNIMPHFGFCLDPYDTQESRQMTNLAYEVPFFYTNRFYSRALQLIHGPRLFISMGHGKVEKWYEKEMGLPITEYIAGALSTTNACCDLVGLLGCNPIILTGLDMAYTDSKRYAAGAAAHPSDVRVQHDELNRIHQNTISSMGVGGELVQTRWDWMIEASYYTEFSRKLPGLSIINATEGGLGILEIANLSLKDVVSKRLKHSYDIQNWIHCEVQESSKTPLSSDKLIEAMIKWQAILEKSLELCKKIDAEIQELAAKATEENEIPDLEAIEQTAPLIKEFKEEDTYNYLLKPEESCFIFLAATDMNKLTYFPDQFTQKQKVLIHFEMEKGRYNFFKNILEVHHRAIKEGLRQFQQRSIKVQESPVKESESKESTSVPGEIYQYQEGTLRIEDPELGLSFKEEFHPQMISEDRKKAVKNGDALLTEKPGVFEGQALLRYPDGSIKAEFFYLDGLLHGPSTFYGSDGKVLAKSWFIRDKRVGKSWQYYQQGSLYSLQRYNKEGELHGKQEYYYPTGLQKTIMNYDKGLMEGELKLFFPSGKIKREQHLRQGKLHGKELVWLEDGRLWIESEFKMNLPTGKTTMWHANGRLAKEITFYDDPLNFSLLMWDEHGKLIHKQISLPPNPFQDMVKKSAELQQAIKETTEKFVELKKKSEEKENKGES